MSPSQKIMSKLNEIKRPATYADFVDQMTSDKVMSVSAISANTIRPIERARPWSIPSDDFGHLLEPGSEIIIQGSLDPPVAIFDFDAIEDFVRQGDVAFLFSRTTSSGVWRDLVVLRFGAEGFKRSRTDATFAWFYTAGPDGVWEHRHHRDLDERVPLAIWLLNNPTTIERELSPTDQRVNARLKLRNKLPLKATTLIRLTKPVYPARPSSGNGSPKRAHDRRGYSYVRKNGRKVVVPGPIKVNGGTSTPPAYRVVR